MHDSLPSSFSSSIFHVYILSFLLHALSDLYKTSTWSLHLCRSHVCPCIFQTNRLWIVNISRPMVFCFWCKRMLCIVTTCMYFFKHLHFICLRCFNFTMVMIFTPIVMGFTFSFCSKWTKEIQKIVLLTP